MNSAGLIVTEKSNSNKVRGNYSRAAKNKSPSYTGSKSFINRPLFIKDLVIKSMICDVTISDVAMYSRAIGERKKHFYRDRAKAIRSLFSVFCEYVNLVTHQIEISLRNASDAAGLSTTSDNEIKKAEENEGYVPRVSISRASRAFRDMVNMGWIIAPKNWQIWDKERGHWLDKYFEVTPLFFKALGITEERVEKQRTKRLGYLKKQALEAGMTRKEVGRMSITQIKVERKLAWRRNALNRRKKEQARKKVTAQLKERSRAEQRKVASNNVAASLSKEYIGYEEFADLVNREIAKLRKFCNLKPPIY